MKAPSLQKTTALSAFLHLILFLVAVVVLRQSSHMTLPSPYVVDLVSPSHRTVTVGHRHTAEHARRETIPARRPKQARHEAEILKKREKKREKIRERIQNRRIQEKIREMALQRTESNRVRDRLTELAAIERIERIYKLRQVISVPAKGQGPEAKQLSQPQSNGKSSGAESVGTYMDKIRGEIWKQFYYPPDTGEKNLEAVISVLIGKDGTITVEKIEKSSGNRTFDRSAMTALKMASPVTPPPDRTEMEIGIRFAL